MKKLFTLVLWAFLLPTIFLSVANAQGPEKICFPSSINAANCITVNPNNPFPVTNTPSGTQDINLKQLNGIALGSPSAYGTSPGAVNVIGVNAFITGATNAAQETGGNLATIATNTGGPIPVGTNYIGVAAQPDASNNAAGTGTVSCSATCNTTNGGVFVTLDTSGFSATVFQVTSAGTGTTLIYEASNDNSTWVAVPGLAPTNLPANSTFSIFNGTSSAITYAVPAFHRYIRVRASAYSSGTVTVAYVLRKQFSTPVTQNLSYQGSAYPSAATVLSNSATGTTGAVTATLSAVSGQTTYICGFAITADATAALAGTATVGGTIGGTLSYIQNVGSATAAGILQQNFSPCLPASTTNTTITVNSVAAGTGGNSAVSAWGYRQ